MSAAQHTDSRLDVSSGSAEIIFRLLQSVLRDTSDAVVITTGDGEAIIYVNPAFEKITGYSSEEAIGRNPAFLQGPETRSREVLRIKDGIARGDPVDGEILNYRKDGTSFWFAYQIFPVLDSRGETLLLTSIQRDVTAERRRNELLERRRDELEAVLERVPDGMAVTVDSRISHANAAFVRIIGRSREEIFGRPITDFLVGEEWNGLEGGLKHPSSEGASRLAEYRLDDPEGKEGWVEIWSASVSLPGGAGYVHAVRDVTEQKRAREEIERIRDRLEESQRIAQLGNWEWDIATGDIWWSREVYRIFGVTQGEFSPSWTRFLARIPLNDREEVVAAVDAALEGQSYDIRHRIVVGEDERVVRERGSVHFEGDRAIRMTGTIQDVTEAVEREEALRRSEDALRRLAQRVQTARETERRRIARDIHDEFGQSLTSARFDAVWLSGNLPEDPPEFRARSRRLQHTVEHLLESARSLTQRLWPTILEDLGLEAAIEWQVELLSERTDLICSLHLPSEPIKVSAEAEIAIFRIVQEALTNAVRHAEADRVRISLEKNAGYIVVTIEDDGRGISDGALLGTGSIGLVGMSERARTLDGNLTIERLPRGGTRVVATIPTEDAA